MNSMLEIRKNIVLKGQSKVFENWHEYQGISREDFIEALEWLDGDPLNEKGRLTREIGCENGELVKLMRSYDHNGAFVGFYYLDKKIGSLHLRYEGKISLSKLDRV